MSKLRLVLLSLSVGFTAGLPAQTVDFVVLFKNQHYIQNGNGSVLNASPNPWEFRAEVETSNDSTATNPISSADLEVAFGSVSPDLNLTYADHVWSFSQLFAQKTGSMSLDETFANGSYTFNIGAQVLSLSLSGDLYPNHPTAFFDQGNWVSGVLHVDPTQSLEISSGTFVTNFLMGSSRVGLDLYGPGYGQSADTEEFGFNPNSLAMTIDANFLTPGATYHVRVEFNRFSDMDTVPVYGAQAIATYSAVLAFDVYAIPEPSTYAALLGGLALAGVLLHRRRRTA
jgi:hypothetical protein